MWNRNLVTSTDVLEGIGLQSTALETEAETGVEQARDYESETQQRIQSKGPSDLVLG